VGHRDFILSVPTVGLGSFTCEKPTHAALMSKCHKLSLRTSCRTKTVRNTVDREFQSENATIPSPASLASLTIVAVVPVVRQSIRASLVRVQFEETDKGWLATEIVPQTDWTQNELEHYYNQREAGSRAGWTE